MTVCQCGIVLLTHLAQYEANTLDSCSLHPKAHPLLKQCRKFCRVASQILQGCFMQVVCALQTWLKAVLKLQCRWVS